MQVACTSTPYMILCVLLYVIYDIYIYDLFMIAFYTTIIDLHRVHPNAKWHTPVVLTVNPAQDFPPPSVEYPLAALIGDVDLGVAHSKGHCQAWKLFHHFLELDDVPHQQSKSLTRPFDLSSWPSSPEFLLPGLGPLMRSFGKDGSLGA